MNEYKVIITPEAEDVHSEIQRSQRAKEGKPSG